MTVRRSVLHVEYIKLLKSLTGVFISTLAVSGLFVCERVHHQADCGNQFISHARSLGDQAVSETYTETDRQTKCV
jgi:hypothetical protein